MPDGSIASPTQSAIHAIAVVVAQAYGITLRQLRGPWRCGSITRPRHIAMYPARHRTNASLQKIGMYYGGRDHSSVHYGVNRIGDEMMDDSAVFDEIVALHVLLDKRRELPRAESHRSDPFVREGIRRA